MGVFSLEAILKILGLGLFYTPNAYFKDNWNVLDFTILITLYLDEIISDFYQPITFIKSIKLFRPIRTLTSVGSLKTIVMSLFSSIPYLLDTMFVLFFFFMIMAIFGNNLFRGFLKYQCTD